MELVDVVSAVLYELDGELRNKYPELFWRVDRIKRGTSREILVGELELVELGDCAWCGDDFVRTDARHRLCSRACKTALYRWRRRRRQRVLRSSL